MDANTDRQFYVRRLPGGGFVSIDITPFRTILGQRRYRGEVSVEQRGDAARRANHQPPTVAVAEGETVGAVFHELFPITQSNAAVAHAVLCHRRSIGK